MPLTIGALKETLPGETRVALTPEIAAKFIKLGASIIMEHDAGAASQFLDKEYEGVKFTNAKKVISSAGLLLSVQPVKENILLALILNL